MATLNIAGLSELSTALDKLGNVPWEVTSEALTEMGKVAAAAVKRSGEDMGVRSSKGSVHILDKITTTKPKKTDGGGRADVTFSGSRKRGNTTTQNTEIAFVNEFGKKGQKARPFIRQATEQSADAIAAAGEKIIGDWFEKTLA